MLEANSNGPGDGIYALPSWQRQAADALALAKDMKE